MHPERYALVERIAADLGTPLDRLVGNDDAIARIEPARYVGVDPSSGPGHAVGLPTLQDILGELRKPGRDPRQAFEPPQFRDDVLEPKDLKEGMILEGVVTNIVAFGAFVDVGVHQDGLVHVSQLADRYVADPNDAVKVGQRVKVTVVSVDLARNRIALSMKSQTGGGPRPAPRAGQGPAAPGKPSSPKRPATAPASSPAKTFKPGEVAPNGIRFK